MKPKFLKTILVIAVLVFVVFEYLFLAKKTSPQNELTEKVVDNIVSTTDTADWKTYRNEKYGFGLSFPDNWSGYKPIVKEYPQWTETCFSIADKGERAYCIFQIIVFTKEQWVSFKEKYPGAKDVKENNQNNKYVFKYGYTTNNSSYEECENGQLSKFQCDRSRESLQILSTFKFTD